jgi:hypothetical protein
VYAKYIRLGQRRPHPRHLAGAGAARQLFVERIMRNNVLDSLEGTDRSMEDLEGE